MTAITRTLARLWHTDRPLTFTGLLLLAALAVFGVGLFVDPRTITGAPAWLKPAKFAASGAIYTLTLAAVFTYLPEWTRTRRAIGWITAVVLVGEVAVIAVQAWRGVASHFNVSTPLDAAIFAAMGVAIVLQTFSSVLVAIALWRQPITDRAIGVALRAGMAITIVGALTAGFMTQPTADQIGQARSIGRLTTAGAHTVGAPDGGRGLPGTGWSRDHGDLRIPHFVGLHALQILPFLAILARRRWTDTAAVRIMRVVTTSYVALFTILLIEALRGEALFGPSAATLGLMAVWIAGTTIGIRLTAIRSRRSIPASTVYAEGVSL
jgi:hypothetical protein